MRRSLLVVVAVAATSTACRSPTPSLDAGKSSSPAPPVFGCEQLRRIASDACTRRTEEAKAQGRCVPRCAAQRGVDCLERDGAWAILVDAEPCPGNLGTLRWRLAHAPSTNGEVSYSPVQSREGYSEESPPKIDEVEGRIRVTFTTCLASADSCTASAVHTCVGDSIGPTPLDCLAAHSRRRPSFLPEAMSFQEPDASGKMQWRPGPTWDGGGTTVSVDAAGRRQFSIAAMPLFVSDGDVTSEVLAGPVLRGSLDEAGTVVFDGAESIAWDRAECAKLPVVSKAAAEDVWRAALCARLQGKSMAWIVEQWSSRCRAPSRPVDQRTYADGALESACRIDPRQDRKGIPSQAAHYLEGVIPWPAAR